MKYFFIIPLLLIVISFSFPQAVHAQGIISNVGTCIADGNCSPEKIIDLIDNIVKWGAGVAGAIALLMYILGGVWMLFSAGSSSRVERGKNIITGTTIALIFILGSWLIIDFTLTALKTTDIRLEEGPCSECDPIYQYCKDGVSCEDICIRDHEIDISLGNIWECVDEFCGYINREECAKDVGLCELNLCSGGADIVCCLTSST